MRFQHRAWIPVSWGLALINLGAVWFAARPAEPWHATVHAALAVAFALGAQRLKARRDAALLHGQLQEVLDQNESLQGAVEGMETQVRELEERIEFAERLLSTQREGEQRRPIPPSA